jgi:hypothetical protein
MLESSTNAPGSTWSAVRSALVAEVLRRTGRLRVRGEIRGESMLPSLWPGDVVEIENCSLEDTRPGEIVLALREDRLVLHRLVAYRAPHSFLLRGDSVPGFDPPYPREALLGRLVRRVRRSAPRAAIDSGEVTASFERYPDTDQCHDTHGSSVSVASRSLDFGRNWFAAKCSRGLGILFCHCGLARRVALKLRAHRRSSRSEIRGSEPLANARIADIGTF